MEDLVQIFGWMNIAFICVIASIALFTPQDLPDSGTGLWFTLALQGVVSLGLIYAGKQRSAGTDLGYKTYPAVLVAYALFVIMALRWISH